MISEKRNLTERERSPSLSEDFWSSLSTMASAPISEYVFPDPVC